MASCRVLLVVLLCWVTVPESVRLTADLLGASIGNGDRSSQRSSVPADTPAPCDGEEAEWIVSDSHDDHEGSLILFVECHPLWWPALWAGSRGFFPTAGEFFDSLHRLRI